MSSVTNTTTEASVYAGFYNSLNGDRKYDALQMSKIFDGIIRDGVFASIGTCFVVKASELPNFVDVGIGKAWFNHTWTENDAILPVECEDSEVILNRIDAIVLEVNSTEEVRDNFIKFVKGTPSSEPVRPTMIKEGGIWQYPLCYIYRKAGVSTINQADITNMVGSADTPFVTGILDVIDMNTLLGQWQAQLDNFIANEEKDFVDWYQDMIVRLSGIIDEFEDWSDDRKQAFDDWFAGIQATLDGDVAGHLQNEIDKVNQRIDEIKLIHLILHYDSMIAGSHITATNGDETYTITANEEGMSVIDGMSLGDWVITEDFYGTSTTVKTVFYGNYNCGIGGGVFINVEFDEQFIGKTLKLTNGEKTYTKVAMGTSVMFVVADYGTWTVSTILEGKEYSSSITVTQDGTYTVKLGQSFDINEWLKAGRVSGTYADLDAVLADEKAVRQLMTVHASVDYLVESGSSDAEAIRPIIESDICAKWINLRDYALDTLYANESIKAVMDEVDKYGYGEWALIPQVPKMTSNTAPYGEASASSIYAGFPEYQAFNGDSTNWWQCGDGDSLPYIQYKFTNPIKINQLDILLHNDSITANVGKFKIKASNDNTNWDYLEDGKEYEWEKKETANKLTIYNDKKYLYYRIELVTPTLLNATGSRVKNIQFYAWGPKGAVPVMTANNAPYGEASASSIMNTTLDAWRAFSEHYEVDHGWHSNNQTNYPFYLCYKFTQPTNVRRVKIQNRDIGASGMAYWCPTKVKVQGSNDGNTWNDLTDIIDRSQNRGIAETTYHNVDNSLYYLYYRLYITEVKNSVTDSGLWCCINSLQFYGRQLSVSVPTMTSNTEPWGEAFSSSASSGNAAYFAFNRVGEFYDNAEPAGATAYVGYKFERPNILKKCNFNAYQIIRATRIIIQASNDGTEWVELKNIEASELSNKVSLEIDNDVEYLYYRLGYVKVSQNSLGVSMLNFYGLDYSEREFAEGSTTKYIYDHGVELEPLSYEGYIRNLTPSSAIKEPGCIYFPPLASTDAGTVMGITNPIDLSLYSAERIILGDRLTVNPGTNPLNGNHYITKQKDATDTSNIIANKNYNPTTGEIPYGWSLDISSIKQSAFLWSQSGYNNRSITITEWWLE